MPSNPHLLIRWVGIRGSTNMNREKEIYNGLTGFDKWILQNRTKYFPRFKTWTEAEEQYNLEVGDEKKDHQCTSRCYNDIDCPGDELPTFEEWAEENEIEVIEATQIQQSDEYDLRTHHEQ